MLSSAPGISALDIHTDPSNIGERWKRWLTRFENYIIASNITDDARKSALLLHFIGEDVFETYQSLPDPTPASPPLSTYETTKLKLDSFLKPKVNTDFEIFKFRETNQQPGETIDQFYARLLKVAKSCNFHDSNNEIKSQIILKTTNKELRKFGLNEQPDLEKLLSKARTLEATANQITEIEHREADTSNRIDKRSKQPPKHSRYPRPSNNNESRGYQNSSKPNNDKCRNCGNQWHTNGKRNCPAVNVLCHKCHKKGHFSKVCLSSKNNSRSTSSNAQTTHYTRETEGVQDSDTSFKLNTPGNTSIPKVNLKLNNTKLEFIIDTGSSVNIISKRTFNQLTTKSLNPYNRSVFPYNTHNELNVLGSFSGIFENENTQVESKVIVVEGQGESLLSYRTSTDLGLLKIIRRNTEQPLDMSTIQQKFPSVFRGTGKLTDFEVKLHINENIAPVTQTNRRIPFHIRPQVQTEIERLIKADIIEKVTGPSDWVSPLVIVPKPNNPDEIRVCIDMRAANKAIRRVRTITPTIDDIIIRLNGAQMFSKLDLKEGYHQLVLSEESRHITTFATHTGLYRYKRLNFGINTAAELFQDIIRNILINIPNTLNVSDDILVFGKTQPEHDEALLQVLKTLNERGLTVNKSKCILNTKSIRFNGHIFSNGGVAPDPQKIEAITTLKEPSSAQEVRSFLGMVNFISKFVYNISENTKHLRALSHSKGKFVWTENHQEEFDTIKKLVTNFTKLSYFQTQLETHVYVDAGPKGLGAILTQENSIVALASRSLTVTEQRYSHIEKEMLAISWAIQHFTLYLTGHPFVIHTDHKALVSILKDPRTAPSARIERLCLKIQHHQFEPRHQEGKNNPSDYLSRHPITKSNNDSIKTTNYVYSIIQRNMPKKLSIESVNLESARDPILTELRHALQEQNSKLWNKPTLKPFKNIQHELTVQGNILLRNHRIVIPPSLQSETIRLAHLGHQGIVKTKQLLRSKVWFPKIDSLTQTQIQNCIACQATDTRQFKEPPLSKEQPTAPFSNIDVDYAGPFPNKEYVFLLVDEFSRFPIIEVVKSTAFHDLKPVLQKIFAFVGIPQKLTSDNGPPFNGEEFTSFLKSYNIKHHSVTPYWPQANGMVERLVKTVKRSFVCANIETKNFQSQLQDFLLNYRSTPHTTTNKTPFELVFNRSISNFLPDCVKPHYEAKTQCSSNHFQKGEEKTKIRLFKLGEKVLCRQKKINSLTPNFDPKPYTIVKIEGTKITAQRADKTIVRNKAFFKTFINSNPKAEPTSNRHTLPSNRDCSKPASLTSNIQAPPLPPLNFEEEDELENNIPNEVQDDIQSEDEGTEDEPPFSTSSEDTDVFVSPDRSYHPEETDNETSTSTSGVQNPEENNQPANPRTPRERRPPARFKEYEME